MDGAAPGSLRQTQGDFIGIVGGINPPEFAAIIMAAIRFMDKNFKWLRLHIQNFRPFADMLTNAGPNLIRSAWINSYVQARPQNCPGAAPMQQVKDRSGNGIQFSENFIPQVSLTFDE